MTHAIPREALAWHMAVLAKTGAGKSYGIRGDVVEPLLDDGERVCIVDPTNAWRGLRSSATGKSAGYPVIIFGGDHGDLPLAANHGEAIAEVVGTTSSSCIIVTKHLSIRDRTRFFTDFAEALMRKNRGPLHLVIDEAHRFAPKGQKMSQQSGEMLAAANELVSAGRSAGLRVILITQRPAKLHNDSLTQVETLVALRMIAPADRAAVMDWVKENASPDLAQEILTSLAKLKTGEGWVWSPQLDYLKRVKFPKIRTFDSGAAPESGERTASQVLAPIDREAIAERLKSIGADVVANDPAALRREIERLKRQVATEAAPSADVLSRERAAGYDNAAEDLGRAYAAANNEYAQAVRGAADELAGIHISLSKLANTTTRLNMLADTIHRAPPPAKSVAMPATMTRKQAAKVGEAALRRDIAKPPAPANGDAPPVVRKILNAFHSAYPTSLTFEAAARRANISPRSSAYRIYRKHIAASDELCVVSEGRYASKPEYSTGSGEIGSGASVETWASKLPPSYGQMLLAIKAGNRTSQDIAEFAGVSTTSSGLGAGLRELKRLSLVVEAGGQYELAEGL